MVTPPDGGEPRPQRRHPVGCDPTAPSTAPAPLSLRPRPWA